MQNKVSSVSKPYVTSELAAIIKKERAQREQLWANGVVKSARMAPRACENHISTEEVRWFRRGCVDVGMTRTFRWSSGIVRRMSAREVPVLPWRWILREFCRVGTVIPVEFCGA